MIGEAVEGRFFTISPQCMLSGPRYSPDETLPCVTLLVAPDCVRKARGSTIFCVSKYLFSEAHNRSIRGSRSVAGNYV